MSLVSGDTIWTKLNKIPKKYTYLSNDIKCEVAIIGAGITGALCSYYFAEAGIDTVIVDKNIIGYGSTRASTSILQYEIDTDLIGLKGLIGLDNAVKAFNLCKKAVYDIGDIVNKLDDNCDFNYRDCFYYTDKESHKKIIKKEFELRKENGFEVEFIDEHRGKELFSFPIKAGIYSKGSAGEIDPYRFAHGLISKGVKNGLRVYENTKVIDIQWEQDGVTLITENQFEIRAKKVIIATGFDAKNYIDEKTTAMARSFTICTKPVNNLEGWYNKCIIRDYGNPYTYLRVTGDNRIIIGGEDIPLGGNNSKISRLSNDDPVAIEKFKILEERLTRLFPNIEDLEVEYRFSGHFGESGDSLPYIGEYKKYPNCYFCLGCGSNGILYAVLGGQLLRDLYLGMNPPELELFRIPRQN